MNRYDTHEGTGIEQMPLVAALKRTGGARARPNCWNHVNMSYMNQVTGVQVTSVFQGPGAL